MMFCQSQSWPDYSVYVHGSSRMTQIQRSKLQNQMMFLFLSFHDIFVLEVEFLVLFRFLLDSEIFSDVGAEFW